MGPLARCARIPVNRNVRQVGGYENVPRLCLLCSEELPPPVGASGPWIKIKSNPTATVHAAVFPREGMKLKPAKKPPGTSYTKI